MTSFHSLFWLEYAILMVLKLSVKLCHKIGFYRKSCLFFSSMRYNRVHHFSVFVPSNVFDGVFMANYYFSCDCTLCYFRKFSFTPAEFINSVLKPYYWTQEATLYHTGDLKAWKLKILGKNDIYSLSLLSGIKHSQKIHSA